jgi:HK97 family phage major capsid protein
MAVRRVLAQHGVSLPREGNWLGAEWAELLETRNALNKAVSGIVDGAETAGRDITPQENDAADYALEVLAGIKDEMDARDKAGDRSPRSSTGRLTSPGVPGGGSPEARPLSGGRLFNQMFPDAPRGRSEFASFGELVLASALNPLDPRLNIRNASMSEGVGADGGFAVPMDFYGGLLDAALDLEVIRPRCNVIPITSNTVAIPMWNNDTTGTKRAGLTLTWQAEGATASYQSASLVVGNFKAHKGSIYVAVSNEAAEDIPVFARRIETAMVNAIAAGLDWVFTFGTGVGQPLGIMNAPALITVSKEGSQSADTIVEANVLKMAARLQPSSWANSVWLASPTALAQILALAQAAGPFAGGRTALFTERDGSLFLLTRPLIVTDACAPIGDTGDLILCDPSKYLVALRREARLESSIHVKFDADQLAVRMVLRLDGQPDQGAAMKLRDGTNTVSAFVALEAR